MRASYLYNGNPYAGKTTFLHWGGHDSIWRCYLASTGNSIVDIRGFYDRFISTMGFSSLVRGHFYILNQAPRQVMGVHIMSILDNINHTDGLVQDCSTSCTVETLYSTIYYSKYFIELNIDKSTQYVALWTHKRHSIPRPFGRAMECLLWVFQQKLIVL